MRIARGILVLEALTNLGTGLYAGLFPARFVSPFAGALPVPPGLVELGRWYAVPLFCLGGFLLYALRSGAPALLRPFLSFLLIGDLLQIAATIAMVRTLGEIELLATSSIGSSVLFALARVRMLRDPSMSLESLNKTT